VFRRGGPENDDIRALQKSTATARENLAGGGSFDVPDELPDVQKKLVDYAVPGLRAILGYE